MSINLHISGQGQPLILFHGWGFDSHIWKPLLPELQKNYTVFCVDLPGFGLSELMNWETFKSQLLAQLPQQFVVVGWSLGGLFATRLATERPDRISHLVNIAASPRFLETKQWAGVNALILDQFYTNLANDPAETLAQFQALQKYSPIHLPQKLPSNEALKSGLDALNTWDLRNALDQFKKPACFMFGRLDAITPLSTVTHMRERYANFHYAVFRKSAHMPFLSESTAFLDTLRSFVS